ncbi:MAG TPA: cytochrome P450 [Acidimicrobiales bacterium]
MAVAESTAGGAADGGDVYYDPFDVGINADPYPTYARLRDEAPVYYNERYDFWALSRHEDVERALRDWQTYSSSRGDILEVVKSGMTEAPAGVLLWEDPPLHAVHRGILSRVFTPRRMAALEPQIREYCARCLDPLVGGDRFDFVEDLGRQMPMRVIGMLLGIPESDQEQIRDKADADLRTVPGKPMKTDLDKLLSGELFEEYIDWRAKNPSDDLMTQLLTTEFEDEKGERRRLTRGEVLTYTTVLAGAGNETTNRLIGWLGKVLADHPDQRRELVENRALIPNAIEETLRYEPTGPHTARWMAKEAELHGRTIPAGSAVLLLIGAACRDERRYADPDRFDIHRTDGQHLVFGYGVHYCLGAALARLEGRVALDEILNRFPEWEVDEANCKLAPTSTVRGWERLPTYVGG